MTNKEITKQVFKQLNIIKEKLGIDAFEELMNIYFKLHMRIDDLEKSRANWRKKYEETKKW